MSDEILAELKKLNAKMEKLLCMQEFTKKYAQYRTAMGRPTGSKLEGEGGVSIVPVPDYGANGMSSDS